MTIPYVIDSQPANIGNRPGDGPLRMGGVQLSGLPESNEGNLPSTMSPAASKQRTALALVRDLWGGTETVRAQSTRYLPQAPGEHPARYRVRLERSVFFNAFRSAIEGLTGFVFRKDPILGEDVPDAIKGESGHWENIDNAGTHGDVFLRDLLQDAMTAGHAGILVEYPDVGGKTLTLADEKGPEPIRPYWVPIKKDNILSWRTAVIGGRTILTQLVLKETTTVANGNFGEKEQTLYRLLYRNDLGQVGFQLLRITDTKQVIEVAAGLYTNQTEIPFVEVTTSGRKGLLDSDPPLVDLAYVNVAFYQMWSDQANSIYKTCVPILTLIGADKPTDDAAGSKEVTVGPDDILDLPIGGSAEYVSHSGEALGSVKQALDDLKNDMGVLGLSMLAPQRRAAETAQAKRIDKSATDSKLGVTSRGLQDAAEQALQFHANYLKVPDGGSISINRDFEDMQMDAPTMTAWGALAQALNLPISIVLQALQEGGRIAPDVNLDQLEQDIAAQKAAADALAADQQAADQAHQLALVKAKGGAGAAAGVPMNTP